MDLCLLLIYNIVKLKTVKKNHKHTILGQRIERCYLLFKKCWVLSGAPNGT